MVTCPPAKKWTVLVWSASENDLYPHQVGELDEMERVGCSDSFQMVAQIDHGHTVQRLEMKPDERTGLNSPVKQDLGPMSMSRPEALSDFIKWGMSNYPAENYWLIISDHGDAWKGACEDDGADDWMSLPEIQQALQSAREATGRKLDVLSFDACYMGSLEVAHQLKDEAAYMVGSEEEVGYQGLPYDKLLQDMNHTPRQLVEHIVEHGQGDPKEFATSSAIELAKIPALSEAMRDFGAAIRSTTSDLSGAAAATQSFWQYKDVYHLAQQVEQRSGEDEALRQAAQKVQSTLESAVIAEQHAHTHPNAHGLQVELNPDAPADYDAVSFARDTGWPEAARKLVHMSETAG